MLNTQMYNLDSTERPQLQAPYTIHTALIPNSQTVRKKKAHQHPLSAPHIQPLAHRTQRSSAPRTHNLPEQHNTPHTNSGRRKQALRHHTFPSARSQASRHSSHPSAPSRDSISLRVQPPYHPHRRSRIRIAICICTRDKRGRVEVAGGLVRDLFVVLVAARVAVRLGRAED